MADPTLLVNHVYQLYYDRMIKLSLTGRHDSDIEEKLKKEGKDINNIDVCETLYKESAIKLPGTALHNQHINFYSGSDVSPAYLPSKQFVFCSPKPNTAFTILHPKTKHFQREGPDSVIISTGVDNALANSLLNTVREISQLQPIGHLVISDIKCKDIEEVDVFHMSEKAQSIHFFNCVFPALTLDHLLQQIANSLTLTRINLRGTSLQNIKSLSIQYLPSLSYFRLCNTNLCRFHILHLGYLIENSKLPQLVVLDLGENNLNHLQDDLNVFVQVVAKHHQRELILGFKGCYLPMTFFQGIKKHIEISLGFLKIDGDNVGDLTSNMHTPGRKSQEGMKEVNIFKKTLNTLETDKTLQLVSLRDSNLPRHSCGPLLQVLSSHGNITSLDLSGNILGIHGFHLVKTIKCWGPVPSLQELDLSHCSLPVEVCGPLLSALGRCRSLTELWLPGNMLTGCLQNFLADHDSRLPTLQELFLSYTKLNAQDLLHLSQLIQAEKMPQLRELDLGANELHRMKEPLEKLIQALVHHHPRELTLNIYFNHLSPECMWRFKTLCQNMDIVLEFG